MYDWHIDLHYGVIQHTALECSLHIQIDLGQVLVLSLRSCVTLTNFSTTISLFPYLVAGIIKMFI